MKALVIGGSGFLGSHVADELHRKNYKVTILDKKISKFKLKNQKFIKSNILNTKLITKAIKGQDFVFMFAGVSDLNVAVKNPVETVKYNILSTAKILDICRKFGVKRFVFASSVYANSDIGGFYRASKLSAEEYIKEFRKLYSLDYTILRYGSLYGPRSDESNGIKKIIINAIKNRKLEYIGSKKAIRQYIHILDAAKATVNILNRKYRNKFIVIKGKKSIKVFSLLKYLQKKFKLENKIKFNDKKYLGHYTFYPKSYKINKGINFKFSKNKDLFKEIDKLVLTTKNEIF